MGIHFIFEDPYLGIDFYGTSYVKLQNKHLLLLKFFCMVGGGGVVCSHSSFKFLYGGAVEWRYLCFATILLHPVSLNMASVLVLFVIFGNLLKLIGLSGGTSHFYLQIMTLVSWLSMELMRILSYCLHFHCSQQECSCSWRRPPVPKILSIILFLQ